MAVSAERRRQLQETPAQASWAARAGGKECRRAVCGDSWRDGSGGAGVSAGEHLAWRLVSLSTAHSEQTVHCHMCTSTRCRDTL